MFSFYHVIHLSSTSQNKCFVILLSTNEVLLEQSDSQKNSVFKSWKDNGQNLLKSLKEITSGLEVPQP